MHVDLSHYDAGNERILGTQCATALQMAVSEINNKTDGIYDDILPSTRVDIIINSTRYKIQNTRISSMRVIQYIIIYIRVPKSIRSPSASFLFCLSAFIHCVFLSLPSRSLKHFIPL